ncbi:uncharacterized protein LOC131299601 [Rhododendron vialii]|uniref:uncharacterized protein LOC131299601 n=1 Tax=Rhododendron vialii TaxID=182163 RepID=UPI00265DFFC8|nr:uncharacterized protein LOC131299601 [Rhododendron vialii]
MQRRSTNRISGIEKSDGTWTCDPIEVQSEFKQFFSNLFTANPILNVQDTVQAIPHKITGAMNRSLIGPVTDLEVFSALKGMEPSKAPGVDGRQISDSVLNAHELMHSLKNWYYGKKGWVALKLDMVKAYDRIEWPYSEAVLRRFGFDEQWIRWVMACLTSVSFATVINGNKGDLFSPSRGIRQGCPLSPYLFILCAEDFHYLIQKEIEDQTLRGIKVGLHCPPISHLFFADDSILFWEASDAGCHAIEDILRKYEGAFGQMVNKAKSTLFFSPNMPNDVKQGISNFLNIRIETQGGKYLGLPSIIGKSKTEVFKYVSDRVLDRLKSWRDSTLNPADKEVMIKNLSCAIRKFWWGAKESENKISWVRWNKLCERKSKGGLGFRDSHAVNLAFLAKQGWRLLQGPRSLFQQLFKWKYFHNLSFWDAPCPNAASWAWRSIVAGRTILKKGWRWSVGDGSSIDIWKDPWLPRSLSFKTLSPPPLADSPFYDINRVADLIDDETHWWNFALIKSLFSNLDVESILSIPISSQGIRDKGTWHYTSNGSFSVKYAYHLAMNSIFLRYSRERGESSSGDALNPLWKSLWSVPIPNKIKMFMWRCSHNAIAVMYNLHRRNVDVLPYCPHCQSHVETLEHMLFQSSGPKKSTLVSADPLPVPKWCLPPVGMVKINVDSALCKEKMIVGVGLVARDYLGQILGMASIPFTGLLAPRSVEAMGFWEAMVFAATNGLSHVIIEGDSLEVVQALMQEGKSFSDCSSILSDCIDLLPLFSSCRFTHVKRSCNRVAHSLAKKALSGARLVS